MATDASNSSTGESDGDDWRLEFELDVPDTRRSLRDLIGRVRGRDGVGDDVVHDAETSVPHDVVVTHDGRQLFAYAADEATLREARSAIEDALQRDGVAHSVRVSRWEEERDSWQQTDPPLSAEQRAEQEVTERDAEAIVTRTLVASSGKLVRAEFEQTMLEWAKKLGVECEIVEHPHLLTTQVAFTVKGPRRKVDDFSKGLNAEGWAQVRAEGGLMADPL